MDEVVAKALFNHWQRNVGQSAKHSWEWATDSLREVFFGQAAAALDALAWERVTNAVSHE
jgi:hypothetical protein